MRIKIHKEYKSIKAPQEFELPDFVVLTGKNGSGKSHLMEAMSSSIYGNISSAEKSYINVKYIGFNGLNPQVISDCRYIELTNQKKQEWNDLIQKINRYKKNHVDFATYINHYIANKINERKILSFWYNKTGGDFDKLTEDFFSDNYEISSNEMFASQFASIFKLYHIRLVDNKINKFLNETEGEHNKVYSDEEILKEKEDVIIVHYAGKPGKPWRFKKVPPDYKKIMDTIPKSLRKYTFRDIRKKLFSKV